MFLQPWDNLQENDDEIEYENGNKEKEEVEKKNMQDNKFKSGRRERDRSYRYDRQEGDDAVNEWINYLTCSCGILTLEDILLSNQTWDASELCGGQFLIIHCNSTYGRLDRDNVRKKDTRIQTRKYNDLIHMNSLQALTWNCMWAGGGWFDAPCNHLDERRLSRTTRS